LNLAGISLLRPDASGSEEYGFSREGCRVVQKVQISETRTFACINAPLLPVAKAGMSYATGIPLGQTRTSYDKGINVLFFNIKSKVDNYFKDKPVLKAYIFGSYAKIRIAILIFWS
jgi:hypothetical protein